MSTERIVDCVKHQKSTKYVRYVLTKCFHVVY